MSETNELEALLRRWAELEPAKCRLERDSPKDSGPVFNLVALDVRIQINSDGSLFLDGLIVVQGSVQEAIEARGWTWIIESSTTAPRYGAALDEMGNASLEWKNASTAAAALLTAYTAAIESETP